MTSTLLYISQVVICKALATSICDNRREAIKRMVHLTAVRRCMAEQSSCGWFNADVNFGFKCVTVECPNVQNASAG